MSENVHSDMFEMLILHVVASGDTYGFDIVEQVLARSHSHLSFKEGEIYPVLHALERQGLLDSYWAQCDETRRRKYYRITADGASHLEARRAQWERFTIGVGGVLGTPRWTGQPKIVQG